MTDANWKLWTAQVGSVIRLEMRKTFFAKRGLWVYLLALLPVLLFMGRAIDVMRTRDARLEMSSAHPVSTDLLESIESGATMEEVIAKPGEPNSRRVFERGRRRTPVVSM